MAGAQAGRCRGRRRHYGAGALARAAGAAVRAPSHYTAVIEAPCAPGAGGCPAVLDPRRLSPMADGGRAREARHAHRRKAEWRLQVGALDPAHTLGRRARSFPTPASGLDPRRLNASIREGPFSRVRWSWV
eukprot:COSAG01_NODE_1134_length_11558_cov_8.381360_1_plen_131_part_00